MNDDLIDLATPEPEPEPVEPAPPKRKRVRWYHVVVLGVAVLVCAAAIGFFTSQSSERDDATARRTSAQARLAEQRDDTEAASATLESERTKMKAELATVEAVTTSLHEFSDLISQHIDQVAQAHAVALRLPDSVDEFNAAIDRANGSIAAIEAKAQAILEQVDSFRDETKGQYTVATSSR